MIKKLSPRSLDGKILYMLLLSLLCAAAVYFAAYSLGSWALREFYMSSEARSARQAEIYSDLFRYVTENRITGDNADAVTAWTREHPYVAVQIYSDAESYARPGQIPGQSGVQPRRGASASSVRLYPLRFADGVYRVAISGTSDVREDNINRLIAVLLGSVAFVGIMLWYVRRLSSRIIRLSREAEAIGAGDLEAPITVQGEDELAALAGEVDAMRRSVIERMSGERRAWEANSELITAISHDIRTPMTALIGYLGLLNGSGADEEKTKHFASAAYGKAMELKDLTDELFKYFLVFGRSGLDLRRESLDGQLLLGQLLGEAAFDLSGAGFEISDAGWEGTCTLVTDPLYLKRVVDNLVSNIKKYADRAEPVSFEIRQGDGELRVSVSNAIAEASPRAESTKIGLRTCEKILEALGGSFTAAREGGRFTASFVLPVQEGQT